MLPHFPFLVALATCAVSPAAHGFTFKRGTSRLAFLKPSTTRDALNGPALPSATVGCSLPVVATWSRRLAPLRVFGLEAAEGFESSGDDEEEILPLFDPMGDEVSNGKQGARVASTRLCFSSTLRHRLQHRFSST